MKRGAQNCMGRGSVLKVVLKYYENWLCKKKTIPIIEEGVACR